MCSEKKAYKIGSDIRGNDFEVVATFSIYSSEWPKFWAHLANSYKKCVLAKYYSSMKASMPTLLIDRWNYSASSRIQADLELTGIVLKLAGECISSNEIIWIWMAVF